VNELEFFCISNVSDIIASISQIIHLAIVLLVAVTGRPSNTFGIEPYMVDEMECLGELGALGYLSSSTTILGKTSSNAMEKQWILMSSSPS